MEQKGPEFQLKVEGVGLLRISLVDGEVIGLEEILEKVTGATALEVAQAANIAGEALEKAENYAGAARAYLAAYQLALKSGDRLNTAAIMTNLGLAFKQANRLPTALDIYAKTVAFLQEPEQAPAAESRRTELLACVLLNTALLHLAMHAPLEAERAANWCLDLVRYNDDDKSKAVAKQGEIAIEDAERMRKKGPPVATLVIAGPTKKDI